MISFIVIGRNEGWKLTMCLKSILVLIHELRIENCELIYVDSDSNDDSLARAKEFNQVKIFQITGFMNAAIARNLGVEKSKGSILCFLDGDMEINIDFFRLVCPDNKTLSHNFISGNWLNKYYNFSGEFINEETYFKMDKDRIEKVTGGLFLIDRESWEMVNGMDIRFKRSQDIDIGLRLAKKGVFLLRKKEIAAIHHTVNYLDIKRKWADLKRMNHLYSRSFLYRKNIFNSHSYKRILKHDYSMIILLVSIIIMFTNSTIGMLIAGFYLLVVGIRGSFNIDNVFYYIVRDISVIFGLFVFYPRKKKYFVKQIQ